MLTIVSGVPGAGKTLWTIYNIEKERKRDHEAALKENPEATPRKVYYFGIPELTLDWVEFTDVTKWHEVENGAIIVIDEAQQHFRVLGSSAKRPEHYEKFDVHRHKGHDVYAITQDSANVDMRVKSMAGRHCHLNRSFGMEFSTLYTWGNVQRTTGKDLSKDKIAVVEQFKFPKEIYEVYKSADVHTHKKTLPWKKLGMTAGFALVSVIGMVWGLSKVGGGASLGEEEPTPVEVPGTAFDLPGGLIPRGGGVTVSIFEDATRFVPVIRDLPMSAPAYAGILGIQEAPKVDGCLSIVTDSEVQCRCNDQRGNTVAVTYQSCLAWIRDGFFDPTVVTEDEENGSRFETRDSGDSADLE